MDPYIAVLAGFGAVVLLTAWLPMVLRKLPLSLPIGCVAIGALVFAGFDLGGGLHPRDHLKLTEHLVEFVILIALMGAGLKLDRPFAWRSWTLTWRLLGLAMPLTILALTGLAHLLLGLGLATALLLGAALAPTDPVLASDVQVGPPGEGQEDEVRFSLTSEAGLNDGLAFPFVGLALALAAGSVSLPSLGLGLIWKIAAGLGSGYLLGRVLGWLTFKMPNRATLARTGDGLVALGVTCLVYGLTEMVGGYGFLAVFVAALALRAVERDHDYHTTLHDFAEQIERLLMMVLLVIFGGLLSEGRLLDHLTWPAVAFALLALFVVRPLSGVIGLIGSARPWRERAVISFYGIRGLGTVYYVAYALGRERFEAPDLLWSTVALTILISVFLHGATVTPVMRLLDRHRERRAAQPAGEPAA